MHPAAKRCITWAIILILIGAITYFGAPYLPLLRSGRAGLDLSDGTSGYNVVLNARLQDLALFLGQWCATAVGASLIGAAVVIQVLAPKPSPDDDEDMDAER